MIEAALVNLVLAGVLALGLYGSLNLVSRLNEYAKRGFFEKFVATLSGFLLAAVMSVAGALLPATLWREVEAYGSPIGAFTFFAVAASTIVIVIIDFSNK